MMSTCSGAEGILPGGTGTSPRHLLPQASPRRIGGLAGLLGLLLLLSGVGQAGQWRNPKEVIGDPNLARLQQGRKELSPAEKEDLQKYGYTGLELMTYVKDNANPGMDNDAFRRMIILDSGGRIRVQFRLEKEKYFYRDHKALLTYEGIHPGDVEARGRGIYLSPTAQKGFSYVYSRFLESETVRKEMEPWFWTSNTRRVRRQPAPKKEDGFYGSPDITQDDIRARWPWEEEHRILGEDQIRGAECLVIESKHHDPHYYLSRRVTWVERRHFLDLHEEQFDRQGRLFKVIDKVWQQVAPWNYWAWSYWNVINLAQKSRSLYQCYDWLMDQGVPDKEFSTKELEKEVVWREPRSPIPPVNGPADLPPAPSIRWEFWDRLGVKPQTVGE